MEKTKKLNRKQWIYLILIGIFAFWATSGYGRLANYLSTLFCCLLFCIDLFSSSKRILRKNNVDRSVIYVSAFLLYHIFLSIINLGDFIYWLGNVVAYTIVCYYPIYIQKKMLRVNYLMRINALRILSCVWGFMVIYSIVYYLLNPGSAREAIVYQEQFDNLFIGGGYFLAYGSCILAVFLFGLFRNGFFTKRKDRVMILAIIFILSAHVYLTKSTLTTIWLCFGVLVSFLFEGKTKAGEKGKKNLWILFAVSVLCVLVILLHENIGKALMAVGDYNSDSLYQKRIYELGTVIKGDSLTRHTLDRLSRPLMSWEMFRKSEIIGIGYIAGFEYGSLKSMGLGTHSELMDTLAKYGIVGFCIWGAFLYHHIVGIKKRLYLNNTNAWWIVLLFMMFFNPFVSMPSMIALLLIIPLISMLVVDKQNNIELK